MRSLLEELEAIPLDEIKSWEPDAIAWYNRELAKQRALRSPADFALAHSHGLWTDFAHLRYTSNNIVDMIDNDTCDLLLVDQPVRHGKSELCSKWTPAWYLTRSVGKHRCLLSSYEADFARGWGRKVRDLVKELSAEYGLTPKKDVWAQDAWELEQGGGMGTAGANGPITGKGGNLLICDDPVKSKKEADSPTYRKDAWEWWDSTWTTRRMGKNTKYLLIMSRWHIDDLMGRLLDVEDYGMRIKRLHLPAVAEDDDELGRRPGDALCPELYDEKALADIRKTSPLAWPALYQQRPIAIGGGLFKRENFKRFTTQHLGADKAYLLGDRLVDASECMKFSTMDTAYTTTKRSDYTALATWAATPAVDGISDLILLDMQRVRVQGADHAPLIQKVWREQKPRWVGLEKIMATHSLFAEAQRSGVIVRWLKPDGNKVSRAETAMAITEQHRLWVPQQADWLDDYLDEMTMFPSGAHDDMVDVTSYAAAELSKRTVRGRDHPSDPQTLDEQIWARVKKMNKPSNHHPVLGRMP
jgi:predicted phage terminase large subunit-like protein